jgi:biopolymer transport protein ExbB/TolQ
MIEAIINYFEKGGIILILIFIVCFVILFIGTGKFLQLRKYTRPFALRLNERHFRNAGAFKAVLAGDWFLRACMAGLPAEKGSIRRLSTDRIKEVLLRFIPELESGLDTMASWISVAPLLGLLGTVLGMIKTFKLIMQFGIGNPTILADGISVALLTTQAGLLVAFPCLLLLNYLKSRKDVLVKGLMADGEKLVSLEQENDHADQA